MAQEVKVAPSPLKDLKAFLCYALAQIEKIEADEKKPMRELRCPERNIFIARAKGVVEIHCKWCGQEHRFE